MLFNKFEKLNKDKKEIRRKTILINIKLHILSACGSYKKETNLMKEWSNELKDNLKEINKSINPKEVKDYLNDVNEIFEKVKNFGFDKDFGRRHIVHFVR